MNIHTLRDWVNQNEPISLALAMCAMVISLHVVEQAGTPVSIRGTATYNPLTLPVHSAAPEHEESAGDIIDERSWDFRDRICERVVRRFANDANAWARVVDRVEKRFGFVCER